MRRVVCSDSEPMPGVSISVTVRSACEGQVTTSWATSAELSSPRSMSMTPSSRVNRSWRGAPCFGVAITW